MQKSLFILLLAQVSIAFGQPCLPQEKIPGRQKRLILEGFVSQSGQPGFLTKTTGIVTLYRSVDSLGNENWELTPHLEYSLNGFFLPRSYYNLDGRIVLIFDQTDLGKPVDSLQLQQQRVCLSELIGTQASPKPPQGRWVESKKTDHMGLPVLDSLRNPVTERVLYVTSRTNQRRAPAPTGLTVTALWARGSWTYRLL